MEFFDAFRASKINLDFLNNSASSGQYFAERRAVEIKEIADDAADFVLKRISEGLDLVSVLSLSFSGGDFDPREKNPDTIPECEASVKSFSDMISIYDKSTFIKLLLSALDERGVKLREELFLPSDDREERFAYVKNPYADEAYDVFSTEFSDPRVSYASTLKDALAMVEGGEAGYCLVPLEERGARLSTVGELVFRGDFKINSVTPVFGFDGLADMKYALVSKSFTVPSLSPDDDRYLEVRIPAKGDADIAELISVAKAYGVDLYRINSSLYDTEGNVEVYYSIVFRDDECDFTRLLTYLTVFCGSYTPVGIYKNLE